MVICRLEFYFGNKTSKNGNDICNENNKFYLFLIIDLFKQLKKI